MQNEALDVARSLPRFREVLRHFWRSDSGKKAGGLLASLFLLVLLVNGLNVVNSYVGRDFITALAERKTDVFIYQSALYITVFVASTITAVVYRYCEERLGLIWRNWYTKRLILAFLKDRTYFRLKEQGGIENPDERITEDVKSFTVTTLSFFLLIMNGTITVIAFSGVMWTISPTLFGVTLLYSAVGSYLAMKLGRPLISLNYSQLDKEANFRSTLIHLWENADAVSLAQREEHVQRRLLKRLEDVMDVGNRVIRVHRNLGFFTTGYNYLIQVLPVLIVAPLYLNGQIEFGVITQSSMAFAHLVGAFSLIINQIQSISSFAAVIARLGALGQVMEQAGPNGEKSTTTLQYTHDDQTLSYQRLYLRSQSEVPRELIDNLNLSIPSVTRVGICGANEASKQALFRATAGMYEAGSGHITRPSGQRMLFLTEHPYLPPGSLRDVLTSTSTSSNRDDAHLPAILLALGLHQVVDRLGGIDAEKDWNTALSLPELQLVAIAAALCAEPRMVFFNRAITALSREQTKLVFRLLADHAIGYLVIGKIEKHLESYDMILELFEDGHWTWTQAKDSK